MLHKPSTYSKFNMTGRDYFNLVNVFIFFCYIYCIVIVAVDIVVVVVVAIVVVAIVVVAVVVAIVVVVVAVVVGGGRLIECVALSDVIIKMYATV